MIFNKKISIRLITFDLKCRLLNRENLLTFMINVDNIVDNSLFKVTGMNMLKAFPRKTITCIVNYLKLNNSSGILVYYMLLYRD